MRSERTHVDKYLCTVCGHRHSNGWYCKHSIDAKDAEIERLKQERDLAISHDRQPYPTAHAYEQVCKVLHETKAQLAAMDQQAGNVLARIHGDGGHYITQHGWEKACVDADAVVCRLQAQLSASEEKRKVLAAECQAWREFDGELAYSDSLQASQMMTTEDEKNVRAARNAARVAEKNTDKAASLEGESDGR